MHRAAIGGLQKVNSSRKAGEDSIPSEFTIFPPSSIAWVDWGLEVSTSTNRDSPRSLLILPQGWREESK